MNLRLTPEAETDIRRIDAWYRSEGRDLSSAFREELTELFARIDLLPRSYARILGRARRAPLRRFPYYVIYLLDGNRPEILAILHTSRHPDTWRQRLR